MSFTADIYKEICTDIAKNSRPNSVYAMRMLKLSNGINIAFSINRNLLDGVLPENQVKSKGAEVVRSS